MTTPSPRRLVRLLRGLGALIVIAVIVVGVPVFAVTLQRATGLHVVPHRIPSVHEIGHGLTQRDNGQLVAVILAIGVWICWALFTLSLIPEVVAVVRKRPSKPLPVLGLFQRPAGALVATVAIAFTIAPLIADVATAGRAAASPPPLLSSSPAHAAPAVPGPAVASQSSSGHVTLDDGRSTLSGDHTAPLPTYEVQHRDTLWKIAEDHLGDPMRYPEIIKLNPAAIGPDNEITAGAVLRMPADATGLTPPSSAPSATSGSEQVQVQPGDTLWDIEQKVTGLGTNWTTGWEANKGRTEPGGQHFDDPSLIRPGWTLSIPTSPGATPPVTTPVPPVQTRTRAPTPPRAEPSTPSTPAPSTPATPTPVPATPSAAGSSAQPAPRPADSATRPARAESGNRYESLEVGGGLLAAVAVATLMVHRRRRFRRRRLGHVVASLPPEFVPLEQALFSTGRPALAKMTFLDLALRHLATLVADEPGAGLPDIVGAAVNDDYLELYLATDAGTPPEPWTATSATRWTLSRTAELDVAAGRRFAPYPCLVSVGYTEDGTEYLLDLEHAGALRLVGDEQRCLDLARYMVAELANNVWSDHLTVTVAGFARELLDANPTRVAYTDDATQAARALTRVAGENREVAADSAVTVLQGRLRGTAGDVWMPQVLLAAPGQLDPDAPETEELVRAAADGGRAAVAVVMAGRDAASAGIRLTVTEQGALLTSLLPIGDMAAFGLPIEDATDMAQAIALDRDGTLDEPTPASTGDRPWDSFTDAAGALLPACTVPRAPSGPTSIELSAGVETSCVLPGPDEVYVEEAATTSEDLAVLAPAVTAETRAAVEQATGTELDKQVDAYLDPDSGIAKLDVLGPVKVTAYGRPLAKQEPLCTEIVYYLWQHPNGVSTDQFANDLWPDHNYEGTDSQPKDMASVVRHWLGVDPRTGKEYFPRATRGGVYRIDGLLVSWDLFRALRARGEARGVEGRADLVKALELVTGPAMTQLREFGYRWMAPGDDLLYTGAIVEVAHTVANWSLEAGDSAAAIRACEIALRMNPEDDRALLGIAKAHEKAGRHDEKDATILRLKMLPDPPERTLEVMRRNGWLARGA